MRKLVILILPLVAAGCSKSNTDTLVVSVPVIKMDESLKSDFNQIMLADEISEHYRNSFEAVRKVAAKLERQKFLREELQCLIDNVYNEAGFEPDEGKLAVAIVTINRVKGRGYPKTVCGVVYERHVNPRNNKITCQFSWTCKVRHTPAQSVYARAIEVARQALIKHVTVAGFSGVTLYHADYIPAPDWASKSEQVEQIGHHIFYRQASL